MKGLSEASVSVEISNEGWEKYCSSKAAEGYDLAAEIDKIPGDASYRTYRWLSGTFYEMIREKSNDSAYELEMPAEDAASYLLKTYAMKYDEIMRGYAEGTRVIYDRDESSPEGYRILTKEEELNILDAEFNNLITAYTTERETYYRVMEAKLETYQKLTIEFAGKRGRYAKWDEFYEKCKAKAADLEKRLKKNDMPDDFGLKVMKGLTMLKKSYVGVVNDNLIQKALDACQLPAAREDEK